MKKLRAKAGAADSLRRLELAAYLILLYAVHFFVYLNGDDFMYCVFGKMGIFSKSWSYYHTDNGRMIVNILISALLQGGRYLYIALNPLLIMTFVWLLAKNVQVITGREDKTDILRQTLIGSVLFACLDVMCLRETVFWITGVMNYLFSATVFLGGVLLFWYARAGRIHGVQWVAYCAYCLLAGFTVEQYSLMFVGTVTIILAVDLFKKQKHAFSIYIGYALALLGLFVLLSAPGNFARLSYYDYIGHFDRNFQRLFSQNTFMDVPLPFLLMLSLCGVAFDFKSGVYKKKAFSRIWFFVPLIVLAVGALPVFNRLKLRMFVAAVYAAQMFRLFVFRKYPYKAQLSALIFVGFGSQIMLLVSEIWGYRCMLSIYVVHMLLIFCCLCELDKKTRLFILCSGITASINPLLAVAYWGVMLIWHIAKKEKAGLCTSQITVRASVFTALLILILGYGGNAAVHRQNLKNTENPENGVITLRYLPNETYSWYHIPFDNQHEHYYRLLHKIPENVEIEYVPEPSERKDK